VLATPVILATQKAEIRRITVRSQPRQIVHETLSQKKKKNPSQKRVDGVAQGVVPELGSISDVCRESTNTKVDRKWFLHYSRRK
jgi:hypothetical protein